MLILQNSSVLIAALSLAFTGCTLKVNGSDADGGAQPASGGTPAGTGGTSSNAGGTSSGGTSSSGGGTSSAAGASSSAGGTSASREDASTGAAGTAPGVQGADAGSDATDGDVCGHTELHPNDTRETATPFTLGATVHACLQQYGDQDFYEFTVPASPAQGGVVAVDITEVGVGGSVEVAIQTAVDNGTLTGTVGYHGDEGQNVSFWFAGAAGAKFRIDVHNYVGSTAAYTLSIKETGVPDLHEPNDSRSTATAIEVGKPVAGYLFSGFESGTQKLPWDDWYKATLPAGTAKVALTDVPDEVEAVVELDDAMGVKVVSSTSKVAGGAVSLSAMVSAGDYFIHVSPYDQYSIQGGGATIPTFATRPYSLDVSMQ